MSCEGEADMSCEGDIDWVWPWVEGRLGVEGGMDC